MYNFKELFEKDKMTYTEIPDAVIPPMIHRIWVGGAITPDSFCNLIHFQDEFRNKEDNIYTHTLWTTESTLEKMRRAQYKDCDKVMNQEEELKSRGMEIRRLEEDLGKNMYEQYDQTILGEINKTMDGYNQVMQELQKEHETEKMQELHRKVDKVKAELKHLSDLLRLYILYRWGGIYMDVDIGIGREKFKDCFYHRYQFRKPENAYMPLLGSAQPFNPCPNQEFYKYEKEEYMKRRKGYAWNYFFATVDKNEIIKIALEKAIKCEDAQTIALNMVEMFFDDLEKSGTSRAISDPGLKLFECAFAPLELQYATEASKEG